MAAKPNQKVTKVAQVAQPKNMSAVAQSIADRLNKAPRGKDGYRSVGVEGTELPGKTDEHGRRKYRLNICVAPDGNIFTSWNDSDNPRAAITKGLSSPERVRRYLGDAEYLKAAADVVAILRPAKQEKPKTVSSKSEGGVKLF